MTYVPVLGAEPNLQPKRKVLVTDLKFVVVKISYFLDMIMAASLKDTRRHGFFFFLQFGFFFVNGPSVKIFLKHLHSQTEKARELTF